MSHPKPTITCHQRVSSQLEQHSSPTLHAHRNTPQSPSLTMDSQSSTPTRIPPGFTCIVSSEGDKYLVPRYMVTSTQLAWQAERFKAELDIDGVRSLVSQSVSVDVRYAEQIHSSRGHPQMSRSLDWQEAKSIFLRILCVPFLTVLPDPSLTSPRHSVTGNFSACTLKFLPFDNSTASRISTRPISSIWPRLNVSRPTLRPQTHLPGL